MSSRILRLCRGLCVRSLCLIFLSPCFELYFLCLWFLQLCLVPQVFPLPPDCLTCLAVYAFPRSLVAPCYIIAIFPVLPGFCFLIYWTLFFLWFVFMCELLVVAFELCLCVLQLGSSPTPPFFLNEKEGEIIMWEKYIKMLNMLYRLKATLPCVWEEKDCRVMHY